MKEDEIIRQYGSVQEFIRETERKLLEKHDLEELCFFYERFKQYYPETFRVKPRRRSRYKKQIPFWSRLGLNEKIILYLLARHGGHAPRQQLLYEWLVATEDIPISRRTEYVRKMTFDKTIRLLRRRRFITSQTLCVENPYERPEVDYVLTPIGKQAVPRAANVALEVALRHYILHLKRYRKLPMLITFKEIAEILEKRYKVPRSKLNRRRLGRLLKQYKIIKIHTREGDIYHIPNFKKPPLLPSKRRRRD